MNESRPVIISKILSRNDTGETGGHQAGILIPKDHEILSFFPKLDESRKNPRHLISFYDELNYQWSFSFIYYNNINFGGTRNEYRLTCMTPFLRQYNLRAGDTIIFRRQPDATYLVTFSINEKLEQYSEVLKLGSKWKVVKI